MNANPELINPKATIQKTFWIGLIAIVVVHFLLACTYATIMPYRTPGVSYHKYMHDIGAPDEAAHVEVIAAIQKNRTYPLFDPTTADFERNYEAHQPPLYYTLTAKVLNLFNQQDKNSQSYGIVARGLNALFGSLNILGCGVLLVCLFKAYKLPSARIALVSASLIALVPMNLTVSGSVNNDSLGFALATWSWAMVAIARLSNNPTKKAHLGWPLVYMIIGGICLGLAMLTKFSTALAVPIFVAIALWKGPGKLCLFRTGSALLIALALFSPWLLRNQRVYGEPLMTKAFAAAFPENPRTRPTNPLKAYRFTHLLVEGTQESATGVFGYFDIHYPPAIPVIATWAIILLGTIGLLGMMQDRYFREVIIGLTAILLVFAAYWMFNTKYNQPQARYLFLALPWIALFPSVGLSRLNIKVTYAYLAAYVILNLATFPFLQFEYRLRTHPDPGAFSAIPIEERHRFPEPDSP